MRRFKTWFTKKPIMQAEVPELHKFIGRQVKIPKVERLITIADIKGSLPKPAFYEINGKYHIGMLRFHAQMEGSTDFTEEDFRKFEAVEFEVGPGKRSKFQI